MAVGSLQHVPVVERDQIGPPGVMMAAEGDRERVRPGPLQVGSAARALHSLSKPTVAAVDGVAAGAGMNLALGCDIVVCSERARFSEIFVRRGLMVDFGGSWLLPRRIGSARAKELALTGRMVDAEEALRIGLVNRVLSRDRLFEAAENAAGEMAEQDQKVITSVKNAVLRGLDLPLAQGLAVERRLALRLGKKRNNSPQRH